MRFKVIKSSFDGISGCEYLYESIDEVVREVAYHKGWDSKEKLHAAIKKWAKTAEPGKVFYTAVTAIVAVGIGSSQREEDICHHCMYEDGLDYKELEPTSDGTIEQTVSCPECNKRWIDVFVLAEQKEIASK